jgi:tRNA pseudouridine65 synthase
LVKSKRSISASFTVEPAVTDTLTNFPLGPGVALLQNDANGLLALNKPTSVRSHPNDNRSDPNALIIADYDTQTEAYQWMGTGGKTQQLYLINRLDAPTSGLILAATSHACATAARAAFRDRKVEKSYLARVFNRPRPASGQWNDQLLTQRTQSGLRSRLGSGPPAHTRYRTFDSQESNQMVTSLLELHPLTGRTHQLRVQCQGHGVPIVGDQTYGDFRLNRDYFANNEWAPRLYLHAWRIRLSYQTAQGTYTFEAEAPPPPELAVDRNEDASTTTKAPGRLSGRRFKRP